jgi:ornithine carbamoyltransferase
MPVNLHHRNFLKELDFTGDELRYLIALGGQLKAAKAAGYERPCLTGRNIALIFEKTSTRTRSAFEVAAYDQGAHVTYLGPDESQIGKKESIKDTARVLGRMFDGIEYRGFGQDNVETLGRYAGVPVWNDARNNTARSLLVTGALLGMDVRIAAPAELQPDADIQAVAAKIAESTGARIAVTDDVTTAAAGADFVYTDVWVSMGEPADEWDRRIKLLLAYQVNRAVLDATGNPLVKFMHCLPALHNRDTVIGEELHEHTGLEALEVTDEVFESPNSIVFDQAENRLHTIKAVMVATLGR